MENDIHKGCWIYSWSRLMAIVKYSKTINITSHNITMINTIYQIYIDRITGINSKGEGL